MSSYSDLLAKFSSIFTRKRDFYLTAQHTLHETLHAIHSNDNETDNYQNNSQEQKGEAAKRENCLRRRDGRQKHEKDFPSGGSVE